MNKILKNYKKLKYGPAPEDDSEVIVWIKKLSTSNKNFIDGKWIYEADKGENVLNPAEDKFK